MSEDQSLNVATDMKTKPDSAIKNAQKATMAKVLSAGRAAVICTITVSSAASPTSGEVVHITS